MSWLDTENYCWNCEVTPIKERRIKHDSQECFDNGVSEAIKNRDKLFKKFIKILDHIW